MELPDRRDNALPRFLRLLTQSLLILAVLVSGACGAPSAATPTIQAQELSPTFPAIGPTATPTKVFLPLIQRSLINLLPNGDFESGSLNGWDANGAAASTAEAHTGRWSARLTASSMRVFVPTAPGQPYKITAWIKIASESGDDWGGFRIAAYGKDWAALDDTGPLLTADEGAGWFKVALLFTAELASTPIDVGYFGGPGRQMVVHVDDIVVFAKGQNQPPTLSATLTPESISGLPYTQQFSLSADDVDGAVVRVQWDFGDGVRALEWSGSRRAALPGNYLATVTIADDEGAVVTQTMPWLAAGTGFPTLTVSAPASAEITVGSPTFALSGNASGAANVWVSTDRGFSGAASGVSSWSANVALQPGLNRVLVQARGSAGRLTTAERLVRYVPSAPLRVAIAASPTSAQLWEPITVTFALSNSAATHPQFPYDPHMPPGLTWIEGVTAEALFTPDNWATVYRRPAFLYQAYQRALKNGQEWLYPGGTPVWAARFAPPIAGAWQYRVQVDEAKGAAQSETRTFTVTAPANPNNHGPLRVALNDSRFFEFADGTPFLGSGHGTGFSAERYSYDAVDQFNTIGTGNQDFFRWWISGHLWASAWQPWRSRTLESDGYIPATGLTLERAYGHGLASLRLDAANPIMFQGFDSGHAGLIPGRTYRLRIRWRTENVTGPAVGGQPYGAAVKLMGWPEVGQTGSTAALIAHTNGDTPWHIASADFTASSDFIPNIVLVLENTTGGAAYVDEVALQEVLAGGAPGPQLLRGAQFNSHLAFDAVRSAGLDAILAEASARGLYFKLVISEKNEYLLNHLGPDGLPEPNGGEFDGAASTPVRWLHEAYWRYLFARFGAYRSVHSWELVNEAAPGPGEHFQLAAALAQRAAADGNPHLASTSTWATLAEAAWKYPDSAPIAYTDFHAYVRATGWIEPKDQLANDSARFFAEYDRAARAAGFNKPVVWGEMGIDGGLSSDEEEPRLADDVDGVWLHKIIWARTGPGGVYPLYWYTDNIFAHSLHHLYGAWNRFMAGIPLANGRYQDAAATPSNANLRVLGQKDLQAGWAHLWIDNSQHTWRMVVNGAAVAPVNGVVTVALQRPNASYTVTWYNTQTGQPTSTQIVSANASGVLNLSINNLSADTAVRITWSGN
jgi:hypothetical protein